MSRRKIPRSFSYSDGIWLRCFHWSCFLLYLPWILWFTDESEKAPQKSALERWQHSLMLSTSLPQLMLHLSILESSITWSKSALHARCRICRRKGDAEKMLLCDGCDRGHHMYCLKPVVKVSYTLLPPPPPPINHPHLDTAGITCTTDLNPSLRSVIHCYRPSPPPPHQPPSLRYCGHHMYYWLKPVVKVSYTLFPPLPPPPPPPHQPPSLIYYGHHMYCLRPVVKVSYTRLPPPPPPSATLTYILRTSHVLP